MHFLCLVHFCLTYSSHDISSMEFIRIKALQKHRKTNVYTEYSVLIFSATCNKRSSPFLVTAVEDVSAILLKEVKIYPNPTSDYLQIESGSPVVGTSIMDAMGREIRLEAEPMDTGRYRLNLSAIPNGLYILKVITREKVDLQKLIIRK